MSTVILLGLIEVQLRSMKLHSTTDENKLFSSRRREETAIFRIRSPWLSVEGDGNTLLNCFSVSVGVVMNLEC